MVWNRATGCWSRQGPGGRLGSVPCRRCMAQRDGQTDRQADPSGSCAPCFGGVGSEWMKSLVAGEERGRGGVARVPAGALKFVPSSPGGDTPGGCPGPSDAWAVAGCAGQGSVPPTPKGKSAWTSAKRKTPNSNGPVQKSYF